MSGRLCSDVLCLANRNSTIEPRPQNSYRPCASGPSCSRQFPIAVDSNYVPRVVRTLNWHPYKVLPLVRLVQSQLSYFMILRVNYLFFIRSTSLTPAYVPTTITITIIMDNQEVVLHISVSNPKPLNFVHLSITVTAGAVK
jgi:hypothetical protein